MNLGYHPRGTQPRDALDFSRQIDRWSCLGLPLVVRLILPSDSGPDPRATVTAEPLGAGTAPSPERQAALLGEILPLLLVKPMVQAVVWRQLLDSAPHEYAHGGLFDPAQAAKPALAVLQAARKKYLG